MWNHFIYSTNELIVMVSIWLLIMYERWIIGETMPLIKLNGYVFICCNGWYINIEDGGWDVFHVLGMSFWINTFPGAFQEFCLFFKEILISRLPFMYLKATLRMNSFKPILQNKISIFLIKITDTWFSRDKLLTLLYIKLSKHFI